MTAVTRRLRGRADRIEAFAQAEVKVTQELERVVLVSFLRMFVSFLRAPTGCSPRDSC